MKRKFSRISRRPKPHALGLAILLSVCTLIHTPQAQAQSTPAPSADAAPHDTQDHAAWRAQREQQVAAPDGVLTLIGLDWLKPGVNSVGAAAGNDIPVRAQAPEHFGLLTVNGKTPSASPTIQLLSPTGGFPPDLLIDGKPAREGPLESEGGKLPIISWHSLTFAVLKRGGRFALRIKDADASTRTNFHGLNWYPPDPRFRIQAKWIPFNPPRVEKIPTVLGATLDLPAPGIAEFTLGGKTLRLEPVLEDPARQTLFFILRDETGKTTTYETSRYLHTGLPDRGLDQPGLLTLDFNRLENPPCAYTPYATCPLPPDKNRLPIAIEAGEMRYTP